MNTFMWIAGVGVVLIILAVVAYRRAGRKTKESQEKYPDLWHDEH